MTNLLRKIICKKKRNSKERELNYSSYDYSLIEYIKYSAYYIFISFTLTYIFFKSYLIFLISLLGIFIFFKYQKNKLIKKRKSLLLIEFKESIIILSSLLSVGYSLENAILESLAELNILFPQNSLISREFKMMLKKIRVNKNVEEVFEDFAKRSGLEEIRSFSNIIAISKRNGGKIVEVFTYTTNIISEKIKLKEDIEIINSSKIFEQKVMMIFPILIILYLSIASKDYFEIMYISFLGKLSMLIFFLLYILSNFLSKKILEIEI